LLGDRADVCDYTDGSIGERGNTSFEFLGCCKRDRAVELVPLPANVRHSRVAPDHGHDAFVVVTEGGPALLVQIGPSRFDRQILVVPVNTSSRVLGECRARRRSAALRPFSARCRDVQHRRPQDFVSDLTGFGESGVGRLPSNRSSDGLVIDVSSPTHSELTCSHWLWKLQN